MLELPLHHARHAFEIAVMLVQVGERAVERLIVGLDLERLFEQRLGLLELVPLTEDLRLALEGVRARRTDGSRRQLAIERLDHRVPAILLAREAPHLLDALLRRLEIV